MGFGFGHIHTHEQEVTHILRYLHKLEQTLIEPPFGGNSIKGLDGMIAADEILKNRQSVGLLAGGLALEIYGQRKKPQDLLKHKDVDVIVLSDNFELTQDFEAGIDWWMPETKEVDYRYGLKNQRFHRNGNDCVYFCEVILKENVPPGLYLPSRDIAQNMKIICTTALADYEHFEEAESIETAIERYVEKLEIKTPWRLPKFIIEKFQNQIIDDKLWTNPFWTEGGQYKYKSMRLKDVFNIYPFHEEVLSDLME